MRIMKRWLAPVLTIAIVLGDCGSIPVFATEDAPAVETSVSENNAVSDETPADDKETDSMQDEITASETELPALHIGQIKKGEELPASDDAEFVYDLSVSFETSDHVLLFADYNYNQKAGTLIWSILRGEKGMAAGSTNLVNEKDDWTDFETVSASPYFTMKENKDEDSDYYQTVELTPINIADTDQEDYDYYIRAAYYLNEESAKDEAFYAAATVPFLPANDTAIDDDTLDEEGIPTDITEVDLPDAEEVSTDITEDDLAVTEDIAQEESPDSESIEEESDMEQAPEETVSGNSATPPAMEALSLLSEGDDTQQQPPTKEGFGVLTLSAGSVTLHIDDTSSINATLVSENPSAQITWSSSNANIATVAANNKDNKIGVISAKTEGIAQITAKCGDDMTATVTVTVLAEDDAEVYDLSGDIWVSGFKKDSKDLVYTGQKVTQKFQVYHKETLLKEKTDYTLTYKNNVNAATWDAVKAPSVTITMKGQYQGSTTLYYTIYPKDIEGLDIYNPTQDETSSGYKQTVNYSKDLKIPSPELTLGKKKLAVNKDFVCDYTTLLTELEQKNYKKGQSYELGKTYHYAVNGKGNFTGSTLIPFVVVKNKNYNFSSASVTLTEKQYEYHGTKLSKADVGIKQIKFDKLPLDPDFYDYDIYAAGIEGSYLMVYPTAEGEEAGYFGFKKVALKLVGDRKISAAALGNDWEPEITFSQKAVNESGGIFQNGKGELLTFGEGEAKEALTEGQDYTVKYTNAKKVGTVTATFTGKGRYKGTLKKKYKILPNNDKAHFTIRWKNVTRKDGALVIAYQKGGAVPDFVLVEQDNNVLKNKTDYTVKLKNNKTPGPDMSCEITGKGNYKGYTETVFLTVKNADISRGTLSVPDKPFSTKANAWKSKVTVKDVNGKVLTAGTDYERDISYEYANMESEPYPAAGTTVDVTVHGKGCYADSDITDSYRIYKNSISKLLITIDAKEYTGKEITLSQEDIHVYASSAAKKKKNELADSESCYEIVEYKNNIKAGTAKVTLRGINDYGGTKTCSFKIQKKAYRTNRVAKIALDKKNLNISLAENGKRTLTATITPKDASQPLTNPTVIWTTSNSNIATVKAVEPAADDKTDTNNVITVKADITVIKTGTATITAIAQDGNKKAACKITINVPALKEKGKTIKSKTGETYQLSFVNDGNYEINMKAFTFESTNLKVASVDSKGLITMKRFGMATIKVSIGNSVQQCYLVVERDKTSDAEMTEANGVLKYTQKAGCKDDTSAINNLLRTAEWSNGRYDTVYLPAGTYHIDAVKDFGGLVLTDNQNLIMADGATLNVLPNGSSNYHAIWAFGRSNVTISGGKIVGDYTKGHKGSGGEWGHGIEISGCKNVYISNVEVSYCWGDGIYLGLYNGWDANGKRKDFCSSGVTIENCNLHHNRRNNLSITDVSNVTVNKCTFNNARGTDPQYGIDIEPNAGRTCSNVTISNSTFKGNAKGTIQILGQLNAHVKGVKIENCTGDKAPVIWQGFGGSVSGVTQKYSTWK